MLDQISFYYIKSTYGHWASRALWAEAGSTPKSNIGDLSIFSGSAFLDQLNPNVVLVGLNISRDAISKPLAHFHDSRSEATDFKIRFAVKDSTLWGAYMTYIIKDYDEKNRVK